VFRLSNISLEAIIEEVPQETAAKAASNAA
jgi:hypothetical protein